MADVLYFAYGSNMLTERLKARVPFAEPLGIAELHGYCLDFSKKSIDGSGKATIVPGNTVECAVLGVLFRLDRDELPLLDRAEGAPDGYTQIELSVKRSGDFVRAYTYRATRREPGLKPYDWYKALIVAGAKQHGLVSSYIEWLERTPSIPDPKTNRTTRIEALEILAKSLSKQIDGENSGECRT